MSNTIETIIRIIWLVTWLIAGWFVGVTVLFAFCSILLGITFSWNYAWIIFGVVIAGRMFYPRNVFTG